ncbi:MAG: ABC transporter permease [Thermoleophilia bacterium]|nr:ABC transporter permease [Thermoleophilia bacterium]
MNTPAAVVARRAVARWEFVLVLLILAAGAWSTTQSPFFLDADNLLDLMKPYIFIGLMALGLTLVVIAGDIDISVASTLAVSVVVFADVWDHGLNIWLACIVGLLVGTGLGIVNGVLVGLLNLPSLAVTLGTLAAYRGVAFVILGGGGITGFPSDYTRLGIGYLGSSIVPLGLAFFVAVAAAFAVLLHATRFGRYVYAIGSNREAARFSGIPVDRVRVTLFAISGLMAAAGGLVYASYFATARADAATVALLDVVAAVVLGGVNIFGGSGTILGVFLAVVLIAVLRNGMGLANIGGETQSIAIGALLLGAILVGNVMRAGREQDIGRRILDRLQRKGVPTREAQATAGNPATQQHRNHERS